LTGQSASFPELYSFGREPLCTFLRVIPKRPINRDVPPTEQAEVGQPAGEEAKAAPKEKAAPPSKPPREPRSQAPKLLAGLVALALVFIVVAIVFASGGDDENEGGGAVTTSAPETGSGGESPSPQVAEALAFPAFATNNTTRIGGPDPVASAAGVALAVFPSTTDAQRPAAVTLVAEEDWAGAIAAAVLTAPPVRAPILFSAPDAMPEDSEEALAALAPQGDKATGGASLFAIGAVAPPEDAGEVTRVDSGDPAATAAQIATLRDRLFGKPPTHFLVASSSKPDFAMPAAAWAARSGDPVLYTDEKKLPSVTAAVLKAHPKVPVYVLGPDSVIPKQVVKEIGKVSRRVSRVAGKDAVTTAIALARYGDGSFGWNINDPGHGFVLARSDSPASAPAAAALSASGTWGPLLLTEDPGTLPPAVRSYFLDVKPGYTTDPTRAFYNHVWVIGDQEAIDVVQQAEVNELAELTKIGGEE
jgi:ell wall binding domain 2 (CWB2)